MELHNALQVWFNQHQITFTHQEVSELSYPAFSIRTSDEHSILVFPISLKEWESVPLEKQPEWVNHLVTSYTTSTRRVLIIWEDRWIQKGDIIQNRLLALLGHITKIPARVTLLKRIEKEEADAFLNQHHLQGPTKARYRLGLYLPKRYYRILEKQGHTISAPKEEELLVAVATFAAPRSFPRNGAEWKSAELIQYVNATSTSVIGGLNKVIKGFETLVLPDDIMTYTDKEWSLGEGFQQIGFESEKYTEPLSFYINPTSYDRYPTKGFNHALLRDFTPITVYNAGNNKLVKICQQRAEAQAQSVRNQAVFESQQPAELVFIIGPTASGKTKLATLLAAELDAEIISIDSRQIYQQLNIGSGKDLREYLVDGKSIPYHLIDTIRPGENYNVNQFQNDFGLITRQIRNKGKLVIACGGTGLYAESVLNVLPKGINSVRVFCLNPPGEVRRQRISNRLKERFEEGMIEEVSSLLQQGISPDWLKRLGLEYRLITQHLLQEDNMEDFSVMYQQLETEIHRFAKRQMTYWRKLENDGIPLIWIDDALSIDEKVLFVKNSIQK